MKLRILRSGLPIAVIALVAGGVYAALTYWPLTVNVAVPERDVAIQVFGLGTVEARVLSRVGFQVSGTLLELRADHGDTVAAGAILATLDAREQEARVAKAEAAVAQAEANVRRAAAGVDKAKTVHAQRAQVSQRRQSLLRAGSVAPEAAEDAQTAAAVAASDVAVAQGEIEVARAALADARAQLRLDTVLLGRHSLMAPYDAMVVTRHKELGTAMTAGEPLFTLVDPKTVWALAYIDEASAGGIEIGKSAEVRLRSQPGERRRARVVRVDIESDRVNEERRVYVACETCPREFHLGEQAEILITKDVLEQALLIAESAVHDFDGPSGTVWTVEDERLQRRRVTFGSKTLDGRLAITGGLPPGAQPVGALAPGLREGRRARISHAGSP